MPSARPYLNRTADRGQSYMAGQVLCHKHQDRFSKVRPAWSACCAIATGVVNIAIKAFSHRCKIKLIRWTDPRELKRLHRCLCLSARSYISQCFHGASQGSRRLHCNLMMKRHGAIRSAPEQQTVSVAPAGLESTKPRPDLSSLGACKCRICELKRHA